MNEKSLTYDELANEILKNIGGVENVISFMSCMTRLRIEVADKGRVNAEAIKNLDKVKGVQVAGTIVQVVLFNELEKTYRAFEKICNPSEKAIETKKVVAKRSLIDRILNFCSSVFVPVLPALIASGLIQGIVSILTNLCKMSSDNPTIAVLTIVGNLALYAYPVLLAFSAANYFKTNPYLMALIALLMIHPDFLSLVSATKEAGSGYIMFLGIIPLKAVTYTSTAFPMLCAVWGEMVVEKLVYKYIPENLKTAIAPPLTVFLSIPVCLGILAPIGAYLSDGFAIAFQAIFDNVPVLAGLLLGAFCPLFVFLGVHMIVIMIAMNNISTMGYDVVWPVLMLTNIIVGFVALTCGLRTKNQKERPQSIASGLTASLLGITEPALYGTIFRDKKAILAMMISGAISGLTSFVLGTHALYIGGGPLFVSFPNYMSTPVAFIVSLATTLLAFPITWFLGAGKALDNEE